MALEVPLPPAVVNRANVRATQLAHNFKLPRDEIVANFTIVDLAETTPGDVVRATRAAAPHIYTHSVDATRVANLVKEAKELRRKRVPGPKSL